MARKKDSPQKAALREMMSGYMKENGLRVKDGTDVNSIMRDMMSVILERTLTRIWMRISATASMIIVIRKRITAGTAILKRPCIPVMGRWNWMT